MSLAPRLPAHAAATIHQFLRAHLAQSGAEGVVVGLSGGIDSALTARLCADALGPGRVTGVLLPDARFPTPLRDEVEGYARALAIGFRAVAIDGPEEAIRAALPEVVDRVAVGNLRARLRMLVLYALARERRALVLGTGNKSELLLGYFTKYGDGAADLLPLGDLYKSDVRALAEQLGLPRAIRERPPSAGFWDGQTDEEELGMSYVLLDPILHGLEELRAEAEIAAALGVDPSRVEEVAARLRRFRHKRRLPPIPKVRLRTIGIDWRD
jgi:NAD+ synthase